MKNVTITLDEAVARWARIKAARDNTSVSRLLGALLKEMMAREDDYERAMQRFFQMKPVTLKRRGRYPRRADLHERSHLR